MHCFEKPKTSFRERISSFEAPFSRVCVGHFAASLTALYTARALGDTLLPVCWGTKTLGCRRAILKRQPEEGRKPAGPPVCSYLYVRTRAHARTHTHTHTPQIKTPATGGCVFCHGFRRAWLSHTREPFLVRGHHIVLHPHIQSACPTSGVRGRLGGGLELE